MTSVQQRQKLLSLIGQAGADGARLKPACRQIGLSCRSVQRWQRSDAAEGDQRSSGKRRYACPPKQAARGRTRPAISAIMRWRKAGKSGLSWRLREESGRPKRGVPSRGG